MAEPKKCPDCGRVDCRRWHLEQAGGMGLERRPRRAATDAELAECLAHGLFKTRVALGWAEAVVDAVRCILPPGYPDTPEGMIRFLQSGGLPTARAVPASDTKARES